MKSEAPYLKISEYTGENRKQFLKAVADTTNEIMEKFGVKPKTQKGRMLQQAIACLVYETVVKDPALWVAAIRTDINELDLSK